MTTHAPCDAVPNVAKSIIVDSSSSHVTRSPGTLPLARLAMASARGWMDPGPAGMSATRADAGEPARTTVLRMICCG